MAHEAEQAATGAAGPGDEWVPVDDRVAGFDRRSMVPGLVLLAVWLVWVAGVPLVDSVLEYDDPTVAGDVIDLGQGVVTMVAAPGWQLEDGVRRSSSGDVGFGGGAVLSRDLVRLELDSSVPWLGTASELLDQALEVDDALGDIPHADVQDRFTVSNIDGVTGEAVSFVSPDREGIVLAYVFDLVDLGAPLGVTAVVAGDPDAPDGVGEDAAAMLTRITYRPDGTDAETTDE